VITAIAYVRQALFEISALCCNPKHLANDRIAAATAAAGPKFFGFTEIDVRLAIAVQYTPAELAFVQHGVALPAATQQGVSQSTQQAAAKQAAAAAARAAGAAAGCAMAAGRAA
jgi:hypothetical protein